MPSSFSILFSGSAATALVNQFGERDSIGDLAKAKYHDPTKPEGFPAIEFEGAVWTDVKFEDVPDADGGIVRAERRTCLVRRTVTDAAGVTGYVEDAWFEDPDGDQNSGWMLEELTTVWDVVFVTFGLIRQPLVRKNEMRRAAQ